MTQTSGPIVFFGNERLSTGFATDTPTLQRLIAAGYTISAVVTNYEAGRSRSTRPLEVAAVAERHGIPVIINKKPGDIIDQLRSYNAPIGVLVAYGQIVPQRVIDIFPHGIVNIHPSLLPLHRGPIPIESAMLNGTPTTGVSLMQLAKAMDAGPVYVQRQLALNGYESKQALTAALLNAGSKLLIEHLPAILDGTLIPTPQNSNDAIYDQRIVKDDGILDWSKPATRLEREIRAYLEWPKSRATLGSIDVIITKSHVVKASGQPGTITSIDKQPVVYCGEDALAIDLLKPAGKKEMTGESFLAGYKNALNLTA